MRYLLVWAVFLGFILGGVEGMHLRSDLILRKMPQSLQRSCGIVADLAGVVFCILFSIGAFAQFRQLWDTEILTQGLFDWPMWAIYLIVPVTGPLFTLYYLLSLIGMIPRGSKENMELDALK